MQVDIDIFVYAVIAALLLGRLWAVLGTRNDNEPQRPSPFGPLKPSRSASEDAPFTQPVPTPPRMLPPSLPPQSLAGGLAAVQATVPSFEEKAFLQETRAIFSAIVGAYAAGNLSRVAEYLSPELMAHFQQAVDKRNAAGQVAQSRVIRIKEAEAVSARAEDTQAFVTVRFVSDQENILRDTQGAILGGAEGQYEEVTDVWTFAQDAKMPSAKWVVVETRG